MDNAPGRAPLHISDTVHLTYWLLLIGAATDSLSVQARLTELGGNLLFLLTRLPGY